MYAGTCGALARRAARNAVFCGTKRSIFSSDKDKAPGGASFKHFTGVMMREIAAKKHMLPPEEQVKFDDARAKYEKHVEGMSAKEDAEMMKNITSALGDKDSLQAKLLKQLFDKMAPPKSGS